MSGWLQAAKILCVRLDSLGDVLMCTPAIRALREAHAGRTVTLLTSCSGAAVARFIPEIDAFIEYAAPWMKASNPHLPDIDLGLIQALRSRHFDGAVIFTSYSQSALPAAFLCYLAGIPLRLAHCRENSYQMLSDWVPEPEPQQRLRHEVRRQLDLVALAGARTANEKLSFQVPEPDLSWARHRLEELDIDLHMPWVLIHPGATAPSRRYPDRLWAQLVQELVNTLGYSVIFAAGDDEKEQVNSIRQMAKPAMTHSLAGELELGRLGAVISLAPVMVANNSGPAHLAAAVGTPLVALYALTNPQHTPWRVGSRVLFHDVPCRYCYKSICPQQHHDCLGKVEPGQVIAAVQSLMQTGMTEFDAALPAVSGLGAT